MLKNRLEPNIFRGRLLSPEQEKYFFNCCRVPGINRDYTACYYSLEYNHCVVLCRNRFFKIQVFNEENEIIGVSEIQNQLEEIVEMTKLLPKRETGLGILTSL